MQLEVGKRMEIIAALRPGAAPLAVSAGVTRESRLSQGTF